MHFRFQQLVPALAFVVLAGMTVSCGGKKTSVNFETSSFALGAPVDQDAVIYGKHYPTNLTFSKLITEGSTTIDIPSGLWDFRMIAWDTSVSPNPFTGTTRCKSLPQITLAEGEATLNFNINSADCNTTAFSHSNFIFSGEFQQVKFRGCTSLDSVTSAISSCTSAFGSVKVELLTAELSQLANPVFTRSMASDCYTTETSTAMRFPAKAQTDFAFKVTAYTDSSCTTVGKEFTFKKSFTDIPGAARVFDRVSTTDETVVFLSSSVPAIIAVNTSQLVGGSAIAPGTTITRTASFMQPNHYSGSLATGCSLTAISSEISTPTCTCTAGYCSATVTVTAAGVPISYVDASYTLTDGVNVSNAATVRYCFGSCPAFP